MFSWLSQQAINWEKYQFDELEFIYRPFVSEFNENAGGVVILQGDYDAGDPTPQNEVEMYASRPNVSGIACRELRLRMDPKEMHRGIAKYVRAGAIPARSDIKTFDVGKLNIATQGQGTGSAPIGQLHVRYRVRLSVPQLASSGPPDPRGVSLLYGKHVSVACSSGIEDVCFFDEDNPANYIPVLPRVVNGDGSYSSLQLPPGFYIATYTGNFAHDGNYFRNSFIACRVDGVEITPSDRFKPGLYLNASAQPSIVSLTGSFQLMIENADTEVLFYRQATTGDGADYEYFPTLSIVAY